MRIGMISDTHIPEAGPDLHEEVYAALAGVDVILHAGDIVWSPLLDRLEQIAPLYAAMGNHDQHLGDDPRVSALHRLEFEGHRIALLHTFEPLDWGMARLRRTWLHDEPADVVVHGDSHYERIELVDGVLVVNPGSPILPRNLSPRLGHIAYLTLERGRPPSAELVDLSGGANDRLQVGRPQFL